MLPWCASVPSPSPLTLLARSQPDGLGFWRHPACSPVGGDRFSSLCTAQSQKSRLSPLTSSRLNMMLYSYIIFCQFFWLWCAGCFISKFEQTLNVVSLSGSIYLCEEQTWVYSPQSRVTSRFWEAAETCRAAARAGNTRMGFLQEKDTPCL